MAVLQFTLTEDGVATLREALMFMNKLSEEITIEAKRDQVSRNPVILSDGGSLGISAHAKNFVMNDKFSISTITTSKNAYVNFSPCTSRFFTKYHFNGNAQFRDQFHCTLYARVSAIYIRQSIVVWLTKA